MSLTAVMTGLAGNLLGIRILGLRYSLHTTVSYSLALTTVLNKLGFNHDVWLTDYCSKPDRVVARS